MPTVQCVIHPTVPKSPPAPPSPRPHRQQNPKDGEAGGLIAAGGHRCASGVVYSGDNVKLQRVGVACDRRGREEGDALPYESWNGMRRVLPWQNKLLRAAPLHPCSLPPANAPHPNQPTLPPTQSPPTHTSPPSPSTTCSAVEW